jgi:hypothetical protein
MRCAVRALPCSHEALLLLQTRLFSGVILRHRPLSFVCCLARHSACVAAGFMAFNCVAACALCYPTVSSAWRDPASGSIERNDLHAPLLDVHGTTTTGGGIDGTALDAPSRPGAQQSHNAHAGAAGVHDHIAEQGRGADDVHHAQQVTGGLKPPPGPTSGSATGPQVSVTFLILRRMPDLCANVGTTMCQ